MLYKNYGNIGKEVSAVGFGGMQFDETRSNEENAKLLLYAFEKGINYFDTAPGYCSDLSEDIFGIGIDLMKEHRDKFYVSTKGMPGDFDTSKKAIGGVEKSLKRLGCGKIDFYHVWCIRNMSQYELAMKPGGQYEGLLKCKEKGLIDHIVISTHLRGSEAKRIVDEGHFDGILLGMNILNFPYRWECVKAAFDSGMGVVAMNPLSGGVIPKHEDKLAYLAGENETPTEAALRFCMSCPQITITLNGFTTTEHIDTACKVADNCTPFSDADISDLKAHISENMNSLCTGCGYCMSTCPEDLPIAQYMQIYNEKLMEEKSEADMIKQMEFHHEWGLVANSEVTAAECTVCKKCEQSCTQQLDITERLKEIAEWEAKLKK
jgi:predicted aldo/keto reductase-like oxidoreductase